MPSFLKPRSHRRKLAQERRELEAKQVREARALAALAEELGWGVAPRRASDVGTLGGSTLVGSILIDDEYHNNHQYTTSGGAGVQDNGSAAPPRLGPELQRPAVVDQLSIEQLAAARWRAHTPELPEREEVDARPRSIRFASRT